MYLFGEELDLLYIPLIIFAVATMAMMVLFAIIYEDIIYGILYSYIVISSLILVVANFLSAVDAYNCFFVSSFWAVILMLVSGVIAYVIYCNHPERKRIHVFGNSWLHCGKYSVFASLVLVLAIIVCIFRALSYPPENVDSLVYHLPRAFYYYKNGIHNIPSEYVVMNYSAPASEIFLSHIFVLTGGNDFLCNLMQTSAYFISIIAGYRICRTMELSSRACVLCALVMGALPISILQGATTQNDLLCACYVLLAICECMEILKRLDVSKMKDSLWHYISLGLCIGLAINTKITTGIVLLPFAIAFIVKHIKEKRFILPVVSVIIPMIAVNIPYWYRNFTDLNGDFLALGPSTYMSAKQPIGISDYIGRIVMALFFCCGGSNRSINSILLESGQSIYKAIGASEFDDWGYYFIEDRANHNSQPYGVFFLIILISVIFVIVLHKELRWYGVSSMAAIVLVFISIPFKLSISRYVLPAVAVSVPLIGVAVNNVKNRITVYGLLCGSLLLAFYNVYYCSVNDVSQPLAIVDDYEMQRHRMYSDSSWEKIDNEIIKLLEDEKVFRIGVWEESLCGIYPMLYKLKNFDVKSIYGSFANSSIDTNYMPETILYIGKFNQLPDSVSFQEKNFYLVYSGGELAFNQSQPGLYMLVSRE